MTGRPASWQHAVNSNSKGFPAAITPGPAAIGNGQWASAETGGEEATVMLIDFRPHTRLRGRSAVDFGSAVGPLIDALAGDQADLGGVRIVCDWVQYRENFRDIVEVRPIVSGPAAGPAAGPALEIAVDIRRSGEVALAELT